MKQFRLDSPGMARERRGIPAVTETERRRNGERLAPSARLRRPDRKILRLEPEPSTSYASRGAPEKVRDLVQIRVAHLGPQVMKLVMMLLNGWWKAGYRSEPHLLALVDWYVDRRAAIRDPFAYFNAKSQAFRDMHESIASRLSEAEGARLKKLDAKREAMRADRLAEARAEVEDFTP